MEPESAAIAAVGERLMAPAYVNRGDGESELGKSCADDRGVILLSHIVVTFRGQILGVCSVECWVNM